MSAELLRRAADLIEQAATEATAKGHRYAGIRQDGDEWAALLTVPVAAPLAAWLRAEATLLDTKANGWHPAYLDALAATLHAQHGPAIELANAILGETL